jgi:hypothetical protein
LFDWGIVSTYEYRKAIVQLTLHYYYEMIKYAEVNLKSERSINSDKMSVWSW